MICPNCQKELADGIKFCKFCGTPVTQINSPKPVQSNVPNQSTPPAPQKKKSSKKIIYAVIAVLLVVIIAVSGWLILDFFDKKEEDKDLSAEERLEEVLKESTTKPIVEMVCEDYDNNGTIEAYAIVGETDEEDEEHPEFYDADIYFVNEKEAQPIKENVSGQTNGLVELDETTYISIEVYDESGNGKSFIYTADGDDSEESDISGKYSDVHEENGKVVGKDDDGKEIVIKDDSKEVTTSLITEVTTVNAETTTKAEETTTQLPPSVSEGIIIEPTASDFEKLNGFMESCDDASLEFYNCTSPDSVEIAYDNIFGDCTAWFFHRSFEDISGTESKSDPLGKFNDWYSIGFSAKYYSADDIDLFVKNVLNVTPDHSIVGYSDDGKPLYYYHEDKFYIVYGGGRGFSPFDYQTTYAPLGDGKYKAETSVSQGDEIFYKFTATVALKSVDGRRVWSLYNCNKHSDTRPSY